MKPWIKPRRLPWQGADWWWVPEHAKKVSEWFPTIPCVPGTTVHKGGVEGIVVSILVSSEGAWVWPSVTVRFRGVGVETVQVRQLDEWGS